MATALSLDQAQIHLREIVTRLAPDEEIVLTENDRPVAKLVGKPPPTPRREPGFAKGMIKIVTDDDDDEHLADFRDYMP